MSNNNNNECGTMYYRTLGNTGMVTSVLSFGFWATFGVKAGLLDKEGIETAKKIMTTARKGGICLWDNAEVKMLLCQTYGHIVKQKRILLTIIYI
jgi:hypothetical protein